MAHGRFLAGMLPAFVGALALLTVSGPVQADYVGGLNPRGDNFLSLRTGPGSRYAEIYRMGPGTHVRVIGGSGSWLRVRLDDGTVGWAFSKYIFRGRSLPPDPGLRPLPEALMPPPPLPEPPMPPPPMPEAPDDALMPEAAEPAAPPPVVAVSPVAEWVTYTNPRFGTRIRYPAELFLPQPPPANGDGRSFASADGSMQFFVFGQFNVFAKTVAEMIADDKADPRFDGVTYQRAGDDWYVLSGRREQTIFYRKVLLRSGGDVLHALDIEYPASAKAELDRVVAEMAMSFAAADTAQQNP